MSGMTTKFDVGEMVTDLTTGVCGLVDRYSIAMGRPVRVRVQPQREKLGEPAGAAHLQPVWCDEDHLMGHALALEVLGMTFMTARGTVRKMHAATQRKVLRRVLELTGYEPSDGVDFLHQVARETETLLNIVGLTLAVRGGLRRVDVLVVPR